jgi:hypothetical protein
MMRFCNIKSKQLIENLRSVSVFLLKTLGLVGYECVEKILQEDENYQNNSAS